MHSLALSLFLFHSRVYAWKTFRVLVNICCKYECKILVYLLTHANSSESTIFLSTPTFCKRANWLFVLWASVALRPLWVPLCHCWPGQGSRVVYIQHHHLHRETHVCPPVVVRICEINFKVVWSKWKYIVKYAAQVGKIVSACLPAPCFPLLFSPFHSSLASSANCLSSLMPKQPTATRTLSGTH